VKEEARRDGARIGCIRKADDHSLLVEDWALDVLCTVGPT